MPSSLAVIVRTTILAFCESVIITDAPGMTAPDESRIVPTIVPVVSWAAVKPLRLKNNAIVININRVNWLNFRFIIFFPLFKNL